MDHEELEGELEEINYQIESYIRQRDEYADEMNAEIAALERKRTLLNEEIAAAKEHKWTEEALRERLRRTILSRYGSIHDIKLVKLWLNEVHVDGYITYRPVLLILNSDVEEVRHGINANDFSPSEKERDEFIGAGGTLPREVTLRFK